MEEKELLLSEEQRTIEIEEVVEIIEVSDTETYVVESDVAFPALGATNESLRHTLLTETELDNLHPINAIEGLRDELDYIEALDVVYSDERNQADYYLWQDENILQENRIGYFVSACEDINEIKLCTSDNDIFGVTVDSAGFIGAQDDVARDIKYGLVVTTGIVHVRCEQSVNVGDYVISNDYGYAQSNKNGYKVVARHIIDGVEYAEITLVAPINRICKLSDDVENVTQRMDDAETNIVAAVNMANAAYNKASEVGEISEEAIKNALEALDKSNETADRTDSIEANISSANELAVQAKAIAENTSAFAETIRNEAVETANDALTNVNNLIKDLEPITTWEDSETGNTGAEYFTTYVQNGVATKAEIQTVESLTNDNKSAIEKSAESFRTLVSSIDKYSVGEYSQSYGLTREQATSILKIGMIYVPTEHSDSVSHSEIFVGESEEQLFTPGGYYEWNINDQGIYDWIEYKDSVAFFSVEPAPSRVLKYWYIDSDQAPEGYEPRALYINKDSKWVKVNIFYNNPSNRITSSISQEVDNISLEITNARGSYSGLDARLTNTDAQLQLATFWNNPDSGKSNLAAMQLDSSDDGSSLALVVMNKDGEQVVNGANIVLGQNEEASYLVLNADSINLEGYTTINNGFTIDKDGYMSATGATITGNITAIDGSIGGWNLTPYSNVSLLYNKFQYNEDTSIGTGMATPSSVEFKNDDLPAFWAGYTHPNHPHPYETESEGGTWESFSKFYVTHSGHLHASNASITGGSISIKSTTDAEIFTEINSYGFKTGTIHTGPVYMGLYKSDDGDGTSSLDMSYKKQILFGGYNNIANPNYSYLNIGIDFDQIYLFGNVYLEGNEAVTSDINKKNSILPLIDKYEIMFNELKPVTYKYNDGTSNRYHIGFIAQDVEDAITTSRLTTNDFAGLVIRKLNETKNEWYLRYDEFIALNTWQIQKAKARITELEEKVAELEALIKGE